MNLIKTLKKMIGFGDHLQSLEILEIQHKVQKISEDVDQLQGELDLQSVDLNHLQGELDLQIHDLIEFLKKRIVEV